MKRKRNHSPKEGVLKKKNKRAEGSPVEPKASRVIHEQ
jgi:hypothetical protein